jgi:hypothetical protein
MNMRKIAEGRRLAIQMLTEIDEYTNRGEVPDPDKYHFEEADISDDEYLPYRDGPQDNIVARYVARIGNDPAILEGFGQVLTDYVANTFGGLIKGVWAYTPAWRRRRKERIRKWRQSRAAPDAKVAA